MSTLHPVTRLAPSPTGALHLGNARTFLVNWALARQNNWRILLRIEDLDGPRIKPKSDLQLLDDLRWLGIDWDSGPIYQSQRTALYSAAIEQLIARGVAYPCICTRADVARAASAPHAFDAFHASDGSLTSDALTVSDGSAIYPGTCGGRFSSVADATKASGKPPAIRFAVPDETIVLNDQFAGRRRWNPARDLGDFVIAKSDGTPAYQLSVVIDDADAGVTHIVRGDDLLDSTPRQLLLYRSLDLADRIPTYIHLPLVVGPDGRRLAKRHGDSRLAVYRAAGVTPGRIRALLARFSGIETEDDEITIERFAEQFVLDRLPENRICFGPAEHRWLMRDL